MICPPGWQPGFDNRIRQAALTPDWAAELDWLKWLPHTSSPHSPLAGNHLAATEPAGGQAPLACDGGLYVTTGTPDDMTLTRVDRATGALTPIGDGGLVANALGHNPEDGYLYGIDRDAPHGIVRVSADGAEQPLGPAGDRIGRRLVRVAAGG